MRNLLRLVGCLTLAALLLSGATARADEKKDTDKKQEKKKDQKKDDKLDAPFPDLEKLLDALGGGLDEEQLKEFRQRMDKMREMLKQMQKGGGLPGGFGGGFGLGGGLGGWWLRRHAGPGGAAGVGAGGAAGRQAREPSAAMIDQLDLPKDQGMVLADVGPNSPAAKAGLKANDILLEVNGKAVSSKKDEADKVLAAVEANKAVDVVVMRKGKKETLKGLKLPEAKAAARSGAAAAEPAARRPGRPEERHDGGDAQQRRVHGQARGGRRDVRREGQGERRQGRAERDHHRGGRQDEQLRQRGQGAAGASGDGQEAG